MQDAASTPSAKPASVVFSVCSACGHSSGIFSISTCAICEGRGRIRSETPLARHASSHSTKKPTRALADSTRWRVRGDQAVGAHAATSFRRCRVA